MIQFSCTFLLIYDEQKCKNDKCTATKLQFMYENKNICMVSNNEISLIFVLLVYFEYVQDTNKESRNSYILSRIYWHWWAIIANQ